MKKTIYNILQKAGAVLLVLLVLSSCEKSWLDEEWNVNPNSPNDVPMEFLLPTIQLEMGYNLMGNNSVRTTGLWMQQFDGYSRQSFTEMRYQLTPADVNNMWNSMYSGGLMTAKVLIDKADEKESPHYSGVAKVLTATMLGVFTDLFGELPYSDALDGQEGNLEPTFDTQETIYATIQSMLTEAIADLGSTTNAIDLDGDMIYGNDTDDWIAAAWGLKARHALQLSKVNGNQAYTDALSFATHANGISSNAGDMDVVFTTSDKNPLYAFMDERGDIRMCATFLNYFIAGDPRIAEFFGADDAGGISGGSPAGEDETTSPPGDALASETSPTTFMSYAEVKFIEAEANLALGNGAAAAAAYIAAVKASVDKVAGGDAAWLAANIDTENAGSITLDKIMTQKYLALHGQVQVYNDWRRTGIPALSIVPGAKTTEIPRRFPYSQSEITYNSNTPANITIVQRLWWDQ
jgi:hypothetical protein